MRKDTNYKSWVEHCLVTKCKNCKYDTYVLGKGCFVSYCEDKPPTLQNKKTAK